MWSCHETTDFNNWLELNFIIWKKKKNDIEGKEYYILQLLKQIPQTSHAVYTSMCFLNCIQSAHNDFLLQDNSNVIHVLWGDGGRSIGRASDSRSKDLRFEPCQDHK